MSEVHSGFFFQPLTNQPSNFELILALGCGKWTGNFLENDFPVMFLAFWCTSLFLYNHNNGRFRPTAGMTPLVRLTHAN